MTSSKQSEKPIQRLALYLKSGQTIVVDFGTEDQKQLNPQIKTLSENLANPESQDKVMVFQGQRLIVIRFSEIAGYEVLPLVLTPKKETVSKNE